MAKKSKTKAAGLAATPAPPPDDGKFRFIIHIEYFKESGKFYTSDVFDHLFQNIATKGSIHKQCDMFEVVDYVTKLRDGARGALPGLSGPGWSGFIRVTCDEGFPVLILPGARSNPAGVFGR